jgi:NADH-ubiquinone oxidoreductase chain 5
LCSYLLISFWFTRIQANKAAIKAMIMNRVGDFGLFLGILTTFFIFRSLEFSIVFTLVPLVGCQTFLFFNFKVKILYLITLLFFVGSVGKSAQIGLHTWLPDAMEGPTPVSALIHAATMVTAGVFLIIRCSPLFEYAPESLVIITFVGGITAFFAATIGILQNDIKKVIAYSTCSQLGYMVFTCGLSNYTLSFFHLFNHAFFKALLFLGAGSVIHSLSNEQDMRKMGGLVKLLPFVYSTMLVGSLALMGFPFLAGFYSKDVILEVAFISYSLSGKFAYLLGTISAFFTAFYSIRLIFLVFLSRNNSFRYYILHIHELDIYVAIPLVILSICSIFSGFFFKDLFIGLGSDFFNQSIFTKPQNLILIDSEFIPFCLKIIPTLFSILGAAIALLFYLYLNTFLTTLKLMPYGYNVYKFLNQRWYLDLLYNKYIGKIFLVYGYEYTFMLIDKGFIEILGPKF